MKTGIKGGGTFSVSGKFSFQAILLILQILLLLFFQWRNTDGAFTWVIYLLGFSSLLTILFVFSSQQLAQTNGKVVEVLENIPDGYLALNADGIITEINQLAVKVLERSGEMLYGEQISRIFSETECRPFYRSLEKLHAEQANQNLDLYVPVLRKWLVVYLHPSDKGVLVFFRDITGKKKQEVLLKLFESVITRSSDSILITDAEPIDLPGPRILYANEAFVRMTGYSLEEVLGQTPRILQGAETDRKQLDRIRHALEKWQPVEAELLNYKKNGEPFWVSTSIVPIANAKGWYTNWIAIQRDITERKKGEEELRVKNKELKNLSSYLQNVREQERKSVAREVHDELGQLASALKMDIDWLSIRLAAGEESSKKRIGHATRTLEIMLAYIHKIAADLRPSILDDFGLNVTLQWHCSEFHNMNGIECIFESTLDDRELPGNVKTELFRIAQESLNNVWRHANASYVNVTLLEEGERICLSVMDNGRGFETSEKRNTLGLVGLRERALSMGGELKIKSEPGKGKTVVAYIPKKLNL